MERAESMCLVFLQLDAALLRYSAELHRQIVVQLRGSLEKISDLLGRSAKNYGRFLDVSAESLIAKLPKQFSGVLLRRSLIIYKMFGWIHFIYFSA
jgi:hypothetical protein